MFRPIQQITTETIEGNLLLELIAAGIAVHSPHTGYDSAIGGINRQLADLLELRDVGVLRPATSESTSGEAGGGRYGSLKDAMSLGQFIEVVRRCLGAQGMQYVGDANTTIRKVAIACGSAAEFLPDARRHGCNVLLTGEARFHSCLEARSLDIALVLAGHYATERPGVERLAEILSKAFPQLKVWASRRESDPLQWA
jgi:dinuclear metal center YbgI/SA1388 family protein